MGHSQAGKAESRERILSEASRQARREGLHTLTIARLMESARLTHGGFYGHFASRAELMREALRRALLDSVAGTRAAAGSPLNFGAYVRRYLSRAHRDAAETGCAIAALAGDIARADADRRQIMSDAVEAYIADIQAALGDTDDRRAIVAVSTMTGALTLSRVLTDRARSDTVLKAARDWLLTGAAEKTG